MRLETVLLSPLLYLALVTVSLSVFAEADGPDYWQVRDVDKDDVLNMRSEAGFKASKTGQIPFDAQCVRNTGCKGGLTFDELTKLSETEKQQILKQRPHWCRVSYQGVTGWVAGRYLKEGVCPENIRSRQTLTMQGVDAFNHIYSIEKEKVVLRDGSANEKIPGSTAVIITEVIHKPVYADLDGNKVKEAVVLLMQHTGGTGSFYYLAVASDDDKVVESYFLGDRLKIDSVKIVKNTIIVDYYDRRIDQPMASKPAVKVRKKFKLDDEKLVVSLQ